MRRIILSAFLLAALPFLLNQVRRPTKRVGRFYTWLMNLTHSALTDWGLQHVTVASDSRILDVGCGGGRTIEKLAALAPEGKVAGVDYAEGSVAASRAKNAGLIEAGRVEIKQASVSQLPFPDGAFDLVTAIETQYYWPNLVEDMREVRRVLKPGGTLLVVAESYKKGRFDAVQRPAMKFLKASHLGVGDHRKLFEAAGYRDIQVFEQTGRGWFCGTGVKPA